MSAETTCPGCSQPLPEHQKAFLGRAEYNIWAREGYCNYLCFLDHAPGEMRERDAEIEAQRETLVSLVEAPADRAEAIEQPEDVFAPAVWVRMFARLLDVVAVFALVGLGVRWAITALLGVARSAVSEDTLGPLTQWLSETVFFEPWTSLRLWGFLVGGSVLYFAIVEGLSGTTPAKFLVGIRVRTEGGRHASLGRTLVREVLFWLDVIFLGLIAFACMAIGEQKQRLGDFVGRTIVTTMRPGRWRLARVSRLAGAALTGLAVWIGIGFLI